jgi:hypothetical protein
MVTQTIDQTKTRTLQPVTFCVVLASAALISLPTQAKVRHIKRTSVSNMPTTIGIGVRWNKTCESIGIPDVRIDTTPAHGFLCIRRAEVTPQHVIFGGARHCFGIPMNGLEIIYQSRSGFTGADTLTYTLKFPRGDYTLAVDIRVKPSSGKTEYGNSPLYERQSPGLAPECAALTS